MPPVSQAALGQPVEIVQIRVKLLWQKMGLFIAAVSLGQDKFIRSPSQRAQLLPPKCHVYLPLTTERTAASALAS